jgi:exodeoxyribonuclease VII small subunit
MPEIKFEKALKRLEEIIEELEKGELDLDRSLQIFEEGIKMSRICSKKLQEAEKKIEILTKDEGGKLKAELFEPSEDEAS